MKITKNKIEASKYEVEVIVDENVWKEAQEKVLNKEIANVKIDGFRPGKAPKEIAEKHVDKALVMDKAVNDILQPVFSEALRETELVPFLQPTVDILSLSDTNLTLKFVIVTTPEVEIGQYKGLEVEKEVPSVTEEEVDAAIAKLVENNATLVLKEGEAKEGDTVVIDFEGSVDGVPFDGGKAENYSLELGSHSFVPGFEEQLVGTKANDEIDVKVTFPTQYVASLAGKEAVFKVKVHEVKEKVVPELDEELIKELNIEGVSTVEELRKHESEHVLEHKEEHARGKLLDDILDKIISNSKIGLNDEIISSRKEELLEDVKNRLEQQGLTLDQYFEITGMDRAKYDEDLKASAKKSLEATAILSKIVELENLKVGDEEVEFELAKLANQYKMEIDKVKEILAPQMEQFKNDILNRKIQEFLIENNTKK